MDRNHVAPGHKPRKEHRATRRRSRRAHNGRWASATALRRSLTSAASTGIPAAAGPAARKAAGASAAPASATASATAAPAAGKHGRGLRETSAALRQAWRRTEARQQKLLAREQADLSRFLLAEASSTGGSLRPGDLRFPEFRYPAGRGAEGLVFKAFHHGAPVAVKEVRLVDDECMDRHQKLVMIENYANLCKWAQHPAIARFLGWYRDDTTAYLVTEWMSGGSLLDALARARGPIPEPQAIHWAKRIAQAMSYLHSRGIVHRDLTSANVLLDQAGNAAVADFGLACRARSAALPRGCYRYAAPELLRACVSTPAQLVDTATVGFDTKIDVYSFAMVLVELLTGTLLFENWSTEAISAFVLSGKRPDISGVSPAAAWLIEQCWHPDPAARPAFATILDLLDRQWPHPFAPATPPAVRSRGCQADFAAPAPAPPVGPAPVDDAAGVGPFLDERSRGFDDDDEDDDQSRDIGIGSERPVPDSDCDSSPEDVDGDLILGDAASKPSLHGYMEVLGL